LEAAENSGGSYEHTIYLACNAGNAPQKQMKMASDSSVWDVLDGIHIAHPDCFIEHEQSYERRLLVQLLLLPFAEPCIPAITILIGRGSPRHGSERSDLATCK
jgi:hypothetical protein